MRSLTIFGASDLIFLMVAAFIAVLILAEKASGRLQLLVSAVIGLVLVLVFLVVAAALHTDPRPFVQNPSLHPLIKHAADNGFPSDHSAAAGLIAGLVAIRHKLYGAILAVAAVLVAWARVAAHVHHVQDVVAGLALGALAAYLATLAATALISRTSLPKRLVRSPR
jgi:membrane-associated phospholipid phosphatase